MKVVFKYRVELKDEFEVPLPVNAQVLCVQVQRGEPFIWVLQSSVRRSAEENFATVQRRFRLAGTGHQIAPFSDARDWRHVGTFQLRDGALVFHLFEEP